MKTNNTRLYAIRIITISLLVIYSTSCMQKQKKDSQQEQETSWAEKLNYPSGKKVIILHADDAGMSAGANIATIQYLENNQIQSAAVMAPCPNAEEFIQWAIDHPDSDVGMHLTLTSEWKTYRWTAIANPDEIPGLIDPDGMFWHEVYDVVKSATAEEVEKEIRAQIDMAISMGYQPDHLDTHMGTLYGHPSYLEVFINVAEEYGIPANIIDLSDSLVADRFRKEGYPIDDNVIGLVDKYSLPKLDNFTSVPKGNTYEEKIENFTKLVQSLPSGLTEIIFHPSVQGEQLKSITNSWQQRVWEAEMFSDPELIRFFEDEGIIFTNWKEIMQRYREMEE
ncbi:MAG: ChbG/HpnK family deacetylase [Bacteroidetes bacterium]|jgi:chitin disaccharide deacetylase|nr:ChbG/HpnK family deacetylase [Bacteroidota bacterium]MBT3747865.1 ChbG/HpnK family deacetylase [Bacteroidota bacterium]MBT4400661.1 ChbG/HpnK family deacetylase [Bacteroidota bacterium]MBT4410954.1 ChbG/HpnK family deacetylase [Bacteroidota bacterium]MBT7466246.1 ChbG/HpnK family deacetylase [Bacteroidota bacterium]